jgi:hypothetical protein
MTFRKKKLKKYQPFFNILIIRGGGNQSLLYPEKEKEVVFFIACLLPI